MNAPLSRKELLREFAHVGQIMADHVKEKQRDTAISTRVCYSPGMPFAPRFLTAFSFALIVGVANGIPSAFAQPAETIEVERRDTARRYFDKGEQAYAGRDYVLAAKAFEDAFRLVPHHAALWNCARSWHRADEKPRAANGYAKYLRLAPADAPDRHEASVALAELANELGRIEIVAGEFEIVRVDDVVVDEAIVYVHPGGHVIEGQTGDKKIRLTQDIEKGAVRSVALVATETPQSIEVGPEPEKKTVITPSLAIPPKVVPKAAPKRSSNWFGPAAIVAGGATIVTSSLLVWSGIDTLAARDQFDVAPTADKLADGKSKQLRTNLFVGATVTSAIATGVFLSLWKWNGSTMNSGVTVLPPVFGLPMQVGAMGRF